MLRLPHSIIPFLILISLVSLPANFELLKPGYFANHDGEGHIVRLQEFDVAIKDGHFPPRLSKNLMFGYGYYFFNFNYPALYWFGEIFHLLGLSFVDSIKAVSILASLLSGITMFLWQRNHWGNWGATLAATVYMYTPYRLLNVYVRGSVAEHLAFVFIPLLFLFTEKIIEGERRKKKPYIIGASISFALLILSHNIMALIFTIILGFFILFHLIFFSEKIKNVLYFAGFIAFGLGISAFFWIPSLFEKKYVRLDETVGQDYLNHFVYPHQLIIPSWGFGGSVPGPNDGLSFQIGIINLAIFAVSLPVVFLLWRASKAKALHILFYIFIFALSIFFMLEVSKPVWKLVPLLPFTQFPWRFLSWTVFTTSILAGAVVFVVSTIFKKQKLSLFLLSSVIASLLWANHTYWIPNIRTEISIPYDQPILGSTTWADEQFPIWFEPKPQAVPQNHVEIVKGNGVIKEISWKTANHSYKINANTPIEVLENTAYYPGWHLKVNGQDYKFSYQDRNYPGRIIYSLPPGTYSIETNFIETPLRLVADTISLLSIFLLIAIFLYTDYNKRQHMLQPVLLILVAIILRLPNLFEPYWYGDEAIYLTFGEAIRQGRVPYLEIFDHKPPAIYILAALAGSLFWFKFILLVWHAITIVLFWKLAQKIFGKPKPTFLSSILFTILTTIPLLEGNIVNSEILLIGPTVAAFLILFELTKFNLKKTFGAGLLFSCATLLKVPAIFDFGALVAFYFITSQSIKDVWQATKKLIFVGIGLVTPIFLTVLWFWSKGALLQYINVTLMQNFTYISLWGQPKSSGIELGLPTRAIVLAIILGTIFIFRKHFDKKLLFASCWFCFSLFAALLAGRPYPHYLIQVVPSLSLLIAMVIYGTKIQRLLPVPLFLLFGIALVLYKFYYYPTFSYYQNFLEFIAGKKTKWEYLAHFDNRTPGIYKIAQHLQAVTTKNDKIFIWGTAPEIYALSRRLPVGRFITSFHIKDFNGKPETMLALENNKPKYILVTKSEKDNFPEFFSFLHKNYILLETIDGIELWKYLKPEILKALSRPI